MKYHLFFIFLFLAFLGVACFSHESLPEESSVTIITAQKNITFSVERATTIEQQRLGLSNRTELANDHGMLFIFEPPRETYFWMKNTFIPLDIIYINENLSISGIKEGALPCQTNCPLHESKQPVKYVLEINGGLAKKYGIAAGQKISYRTAS